MKQFEYVVYLTFAIHIGIVVSGLLSEVHFSE